MDDGMKRLFDATCWAALAAVGACVALMGLLIAGLALVATANATAKAERARPRLVAQMTEKEGFEPSRQPFSHLTP